MGKLQDVRMSKGDREKFYPAPFHPFMPKDSSVHLPSIVIDT